MDERLQDKSIRRSVHSTEPYKVLKNTDDSYIDGLGLLKGKPSEDVIPYSTAHVAVRHQVLGNMPISTINYV